MVKVICLYRGARRKRNCNPTTGAEAKALHDRLCRAEDSADYSLVFVLNEDGDEVAWGCDCGCGNRYYQRKNEGGSFGAYADAYRKFWSLYGWWMFQEDDILVTDLGVFKEAVDYMKANPRVGFVALSPMAKSPMLHCGGGFGVGRREALDAVCAIHGGRLPAAKSNAYGDLEWAEVQFTGGIIEAGWEMHHLPGVSPFAENWKDHESQRENGLGSKEGRHVYRVGL